MNTRLTRTAILLASATLVTGGMVASATPAPAEAAPVPYMSRAWAPWTNPARSSTVGLWTISRNTKVTMRCWTTGVTRLSTAKWFYVTSKSYPYTRGYVPANAVASQAWVGHC